MDDAVAEASAAAGQTSGTLRINTLGMAARQIIAPRLGRFHRAHPDVVLDIVVDDALSDIVAGRFDAGIRVGGRLEKDMIAVRLTPDVKMIAVASPDYLARRGMPHSPADLHGHACINWRLQGDGRVYRWEFEKKGKRLEVAVEGPLITNQSDIGAAAALQGLGILYAFDHERVDEALARGTAGAGPRRLVDHQAGALPVLLEPAPPAAGTGRVHRLSAGSRPARIQAQSQGHRLTRSPTPQSLDVPPRRTGACSLAPASTTGSRLQASDDRIAARSAKARRITASPRLLADRLVRSARLGQEDRIDRGVDLALGLPGDRRRASGATPRLSSRSPAVQG